MLPEPPIELDDTTSAVIGAAVEVHRVLGPGFLETVYEEAMAIEFRLRGISFERQKIVNVAYKGYPIGEGKLDFFVKDSLVVELKAVEKILPIHQAQIMSYLKATGYRLGLLINFHERLLREGVRRVVLTPSDESARAQILGAA
jgi:GxxExxY protein